MVYVKLTCVVMGVRRGGQKGHLTPLEIETENDNFLEKMKSAAQFQSVDVILPVPVAVASQIHCFGVMH